MKTYILIFLLTSIFTCSFAQRHTSELVSIPEGYSELVFNDEFNGTGLPDASKWDYEMGHLRNREKQYYMAERLENSYLKDGCLHLTARNDSVEVDGMVRPITSASIHTRNKFNFTYGRVEVRAKLPFSLGTWPAIWMMPAKKVYGNWPNSGEIDIMEHVGYEPEKIHYAVHTLTTHTTKVGKGSNVFCPTSYTDFHIYAFEWYEDRLEWHLDGKKRFVLERPADATWENWPFDQSFYLILNLAFGGGWGGLKGIDPQSLPQEYIIDYIRVFK